MEIAYLGNNCVKIRSKLANFIIDPTENISKTEADAIISLNGNESNISKVSQFRLIVSGPGEYEIKGVKISGTKSDAGIIYRLTLDKLGVILGKASLVSKSENVSANVVVLDADEVPSDKVITAMQPNVVVMYGEKAKEAAKTLKDGGVESVNRFVVAYEKLPQEMEVVVLG
ncbi:MAG: hypothetical protein WD992_01055 [Candidatus Levyibacteriota bacterium]